MKILLIEGIEKVNADMWKNFISHIISEEDEFWDMDGIVDELLAENILS